MSENTKIEWADHTFNPWIGCTKVGPGCDNCYAKADFEDRKHRVVWGAGHPRSRTSIANWKQPIKWNHQAGFMLHAWEFGIEIHGGDETACIAAGFIKPQRPKVFCASLADVFDKAVDPQWRVDLFELIAKTPNLDWLLLTKRIGNAHAMLNATIETMAHGINDWDCVPWPNIWIGATIVNQEEADRDIPKLQAVPAAKRFLSMEPLLGPVDLTRLVCCDSCNEMRNEWDRGNHRCGYCGVDRWSGVDWVIVGGESGPNARPMHPDWARSLRDQCKVANSPFLFKQWGEWAPYDRGAVDSSSLSNPRSMDLPMTKFGKKAAGRLLDGITQDGYPA